MKHKHRTISGELGWSERHRGVHWDTTLPSPKNLGYRPWGLSVLQTHCVTSCFFPWVPDHILKILSHLTKHLTSRTFRRKSSGTTAFPKSEKSPLGHWKVVMPCYIKCEVLGGTVQKVCLGGRTAAHTVQPSPRGRTTQPSQLRLHLADKPKVPKVHMHLSLQKSIINKK